MVGLARISQLTLMTLLLYRDPCGRVTCIWPPGASNELQVEEFMASTGADADGITRALDGVRHVSWRSGRTFRRKYAVLLAAAEVSPGRDGRVRVSCSLALSVSRYRSDREYSPRFQSNMNETSRNMFEARVALLRRACRLYKFS